MFCPVPGGASTGDDALLDLPEPAPVTAPPRAVRSLHEDVCVCAGLAKMPVQPAEVPVRVTIRAGERREAQTHIVEPTLTRRGPV